MSRVVKIESWADADETLRRKGLAEIGIKRIEARLAEQVGQLKQRAIQDSRPHQVTAGDADEALEAFFRGQGIRTKRLNFGTLKLRLSRGLRLLKPAADVFAALGCGFAHYIRIRSDIDKAALLDAPADDLKKLAKFVEIESRETFSAQPDHQAIERLAQKEVED